MRAEVAEVAELELTMANGASWSLDAGESDMRRLVISLSRKMSTGAREVVRVAGQAYHNGVPHPIELHVRTDELVGVRLRAPRRETDGRPSGRDAGRLVDASTRGADARAEGRGSRAKESKSEGK